MSRLTPSGMPKGKPFPENELVWLDCPECEYHVRVHQSTQEANMRQHKEKGCPLVTNGETPEVENRSPLELQAPLCPEPCSDCSCRIPDPETLSPPLHSWEPLRKALSEEEYCNSGCTHLAGEEHNWKPLTDEKQYAGYLAKVNAEDVPGHGARPSAERKEPMPSPFKTILEEAGELVDGPREAHYGHPYDDFSRAIGAFNALFEDYLKQPLEVRHWPLIMQLVKLSREINEPKRDNWIDGAGYWRTLEKVMDHEDEGQYR